MPSISGNDKQPCKVNHQQIRSQTSAINVNATIDHNGTLKHARLLAESRALGFVSAHKQRVWNQWRKGWSTWQIHWARQRNIDQGFKHTSSNLSVALDSFKILGLIITTSSPCNTQQHTHTRLAHRHGCADFWCMQLTTLILLPRLFEIKDLMAFQHLNVLHDTIINRSTRLIVHTIWASGCFEESLATTGPCTWTSRNSHWVFDKLLFSRGAFRKLAVESMQTLAGGIICVCYWGGRPIIPREDRRRWNTPLRMWTLVLSRHVKPNLQPQTCQVRIFTRNKPKIIRKLDILGCYSKHTCLSRIALRIVDQHAHIYSHLGSGKAHPHCPAPSGKTKLNTVADKTLHTQESNRYSPG